MKIIPIFGKNLFAIQHTGETQDEFAKMFDLWQDPEFLEEFFETHKIDLINNYWGDWTIEEAIIKTFEYAQDFENKLLELSRQS